MYNMSKANVRTFLEPQTSFWASKDEKNQTFVNFWMDFDLTISCSMEYNRFPFDEHLCYTRFTTMDLQNGSLIFKMGKNAKWTQSADIIRDYDVEIVQLSQGENLMKAQSYGDSWSVAGKIVNQERVLDHELL